MLDGPFWDLVDENADYEKVEQAFLDMCAPLGIHTISCIELRAPTHSSPVFLGRMFGKRDGDYLTRYRKEELVEHDVVAQHAKETAQGFYWDDLKPKAITRKQQDVFSIACEHGFSDGYLSPFYGVGGRMGFTGFFGSKLCNDPVTGRLLNFAGKEFYRYAFQKAAIESIDGAEPVIVLTSRQKEVLYWISKGKTDWEMSRLLNIAVPTVNRHVEMAKERIGVRSRAEAVHFALTNNLIMQG